ncbi:helix-turn-helix domain-containing protein [Paenibacillus swuensis]|uniref:helix-turn-helix domain-containing protein n=1 Tax=Paenibacillus swuensis TaxID=1178515 RepID=UPI000837F70E|nr:AraC family transcriptional regulator [Paenibacillus swuensis]
MTSYYKFTTPPWPHFVVGGIAALSVGEGHQNRSNIGVFDMLIVTKGKLSVREGGELWELFPGHMLILRPDLYHESGGACTERTEYFWLHFQTSGDWEEVRQFQEGEPYPKAYSYNERVELTSVSRETERSGELPFAYKFSLPKSVKLPDAERVYRQLMTMIEFEHSPALESRIQQQLLFQKLLHKLSSESKERIISASCESIAKDVAAYIHQHYDQPDVYEQVKGTFHYSTAYLTRCMKQMYGYTLVDYLQQYRIRQATAMLKESKYSITEVAYQVGYRNYSHFTKCFVKYTGLIPKSYRKLSKDHKPQLCDISADASPCYNELDS